MRSTTMAVANFSAVFMLFIPAAHGPNPSCVSGTWNPHLAWIRPTAVQPSDPPRQLIARRLSDRLLRRGVRPITIVAVPGLPGSGQDYRWLAPQLTAQGSG